MSFNVVAKTINKKSRDYFLFIFIHCRRINDYCNKCITLWMAITNRLFESWFTQINFTCILHCWKSVEMKCVISYVWITMYVITAPERIHTRRPPFYYLSLTRPFVNENTLRDDDLPEESKRGLVPTSVYQCMCQCFSMSTSLFTLTKL